MPHHKHHEKLERLKEAIKNHPEMSEEQKSNALAHIEEWYIEDQADRVILKELRQKLLQISEKLEPILAELGFL